MTRGAFLSRFICNPKALFTHLQRSSGDILQRTAVEFILSFTTVSLSLTLMVVEALLFGVDGYEGVLERTTST
jgi:preprotein translocase subunit SecG